MNIDFINSNAKSPGIIAKLKTSRYQNSANILYKIDMAIIAIFNILHIQNSIPWINKKAIVMSQKQKH